MAPRANHIALRARAPRSSPAHTRSALRPCAHALCAPALRACISVHALRCARLALGSAHARARLAFGLHTRLGSRSARLARLAQRERPGEGVCPLAHGRRRTHRRPAECFAPAGMRGIRKRAERRRTPATAAHRPLCSYAGEVECAERNAEVGTPSRGELPTGLSNVTLHGSASGSEPREARRGDVIVAASAPLTHSVVILERRRALTLRPTHRTAVASEPEAMAPGSTGVGQGSRRVTRRAHVPRWVARTVMKLREHRGWQLDRTTK